MTGGQAGSTAAPSAPSGMQTAPASNTRSDNPQRPAGARDNDRRRDRQRRTRSSIA